MQPCAFLSAILLVMCGCSQQPTKLAGQIAVADRLVATNFGTRVALSLSGNEVKKIVNAISGAKRDRHHYPAMFDWELRFYSGSNFITSVRMQDRLFLTDHAQYSDETGVLKSLYEGPFQQASERNLSQ